MENKEVNGSVSVSNDVNIGGDVLVQGKTHLKSGLKVDGILEVDNVKVFNGFIGYFYGVSSVLREIKLPEKGMYFINGETNSIWVWDALSRVWIDTNRVDSGLKGMLTDREGNAPADYRPSQERGVKEAYFYVAECEPDSTKDITFVYFKNGTSSVSVTIDKTSIVCLYWNGDYWETSVVPMNVDLSKYAIEADVQDLKNSSNRFTFSSNETVNKFFKELYVVSTNEDFSIDELYINSIARRYTNPSSGNTYWGITFVREGSEKALHHTSYEMLEGVDVLEVDLSEDDVVAKLYAVVDWSAIEEGTLFTTGQNIPLKYWNELKYSPYISAYLSKYAIEADNVKFIDSNQYAEVFKELYIDSFENKIYHKEEGKSVNTYLEDIPLDKVNLQLMNTSRKVFSQSSGRNYWNLVFSIKTPEYETRDGKNYIVRDSNGEVKYTRSENFYFNLFEESNGVIDEYLTYNVILREENGEVRYYTYRMRLYAVMDWSKIEEGTSVNFNPRGILDTAYNIDNSPQIKKYIDEKESYLPIKIEAKTTFNLTSNNRIMLYGASQCSDSYSWFKEWLEKYTGAEVINAGNAGWSAKQLASTDYYNKVESINPDVIYVMLGGNDKGDDVGTFGAISSQSLVEEISLTESWSNAESGNKEYKFIQCLDYILRKLKSEYYDVKDNPKEDKRFPYIVVGTFTSQHREGYEMMEYNDPQNWLNKRNAIVECANKNNLPCIDVFSEIGIDWDKEPYYNQDFDYNASTSKPTLVNRGIYTLDGLHLNEYGFERLARLLSGALLPSNDILNQVSSVKDSISILDKTTNQNVFCTTEEGNEIFKEVYFYPYVEIRDVESITITKKDTKYQITFKDSESRYSYVYLGNSSAVLNGEVVSGVVEGTGFASGATMYAVIDWDKVVNDKPILTNFTHLIANSKYSPIITHVMQSYKFVKGSLGNAFIRELYLKDLRREEYVDGELTSTHDYRYTLSDIPQIFTLSNVSRNVNGKWVINFGASYDGKEYPFKFETSVNPENDTVIKSDLLCWIEDGSVQYKAIMYAVVDWTQIPDGTSVNYGRPLLSGVVQKKISPTISNYIEFGNKVKWSESFNLDDYKTQGIYYISGERLLSECDNLPIMNAASGHTISGQLTVLDASLSDAEQCITQYLKLTNRTGSEGKEYIRTYNKYSNGTEGWSVWKELQGTTYLGQVTKAQLDTVIDNGIYTGVVTDNELLPQGSTFTLIVLNNYAVNSAVGMPAQARQVSQTFVYLPLVDVSTGSIVPQDGQIIKRTGVGDTIINWLPSSVLGEMVYVTQGYGHFAINADLYNKVYIVGGGPGTVYLDFTATKDRVVDIFIINDMAAKPQFTINGSAEFSISSNSFRVGLYKLGISLSNGNKRAVLTYIEGEAFNL